MQSFISETLDAILKRTTSAVKDAVIILPSQRAKVFVKQALKDKINTGFLPEVITIEQFISNVSKIEKIDNIQLLFHFYSIYKKIEPNPDRFDVFYSWAFTVLQDYNEIDQHLVNPKEIFEYLKDIQRLKKWTVDGVFKETPLIKSHQDFLEKLYDYYIPLYAYLKENGVGYQGVMYREACGAITNFLENNTTNYFFVGFNALNKAEEFLFKRVLEKGYSDVYWDLDTAFFNSNHQAGKFIRQYKKTWRYYEKNELQLLSSHFNTNKHIEVIGASKNVTQIKYAGQLLEDIKDFKNTALVLADETLLPVTLNALPPKLEAVNITMGYPLKDMPTTSLLFAIFKLYLSQEKLGKTTQHQFYFKDVITLFKQPLIYSVFTEKDSSLVEPFITQLTKENRIFLEQKHIKTIIKKAITPQQNAVLHLFVPHESITAFIDKILQLISLLKDDVTVLEKEYLFRFFTVFTQLKTLQITFGYFTSLKTLWLFFNQLIATETISFQGEPLRGLQLMGMLETRVLDFENVILTSTNEGVLPASATQNSFIPFDVKVTFNLPTYKEKDAIFSYHFFRLLQRAKRIYILYNTESDGFGNGEKSRFIAQLALIKDRIIYKTIAPKIASNPPALKQVAKTAAVIKQLEVFGKKGISPSSLTNYLHNQIAFYKQKVLQIKEFNTVEETVAYNTLGTVVHDTLDALYTPFVGQFLSKTHVLDMQKKANSLVEHYFAIHFKNGNISTGKNRLIFEVAKKFVANFLKIEYDLLKHNTLKIIATEDTLETEITIDGIDYPIKLRGQVDRVDELNGQLRIIDYKTGIVKKENLTVPDFTKLREEKHLKALQVLMYTYLYTKNNAIDFNKPITAGIYSFKNLNTGFIPIDFKMPRKPSETAITKPILEAFLEELKTYILEIYTKDIPFLEPANLEY